MKQPSTSMIEAIELLGQPAMRLVAPDGAEATVLLHGAHLVSWIPAGDQERLYLSPQAVAGAGKAVRGGIPVVFPQFGQNGPLPQHGFARDRAWQWVDGAVRGGAAIGVLRLADDAATRTIWPYAFEAELSFTLAGLQLEVELAVTNTGDAPFDFTAALHSYLRVDDVRRARLGGLYAVHYRDKLTGAEQRQEIDPFSFVGEIDRIYVHATQPLILSTAMGRMVITRDGFDDVVVWNPGPARAAAMPDLPADGWLQMLCVEAAAVGHAVHLAPGQQWVARQGFEV